MTVNLINSKISLHYNNFYKGKFAIFTISPNYSHEIVAGCNVQVPAEVMIMNSIVLPHKELGGSYKNQIILWKIKRKCPLLPPLI